MWSYSLLKFEAIRGVIFGIRPLLVIFLGREWFWEKIFSLNLILDKYLKLCIPKVFFNLNPQKV